MRYKLLAVIIIPIIVFGLYFAYNQPTSSMIKTTDTAPKFHSFMEDAHVVKFDENGNKSFEAFADQWFYFPLIKRTELFLPNIILPKSSENNWTIRSNEATLYHLQNGEIELAEFSKSVLATYKTQDNSDLNLQTEKMRYFPNKHLLSSKKEVTMLHQKNKINSIGANINLLTEKIELLDNVKGEYLP